MQITACISPLAMCETVFPRIKAFQPDYLFVASGFDAMHNDGYAAQRLTAEWYGRPALLPAFRSRRKI